MARAQAVCDRCPVSDECYEYARRDRERSGIWGGVILEPSSKRRRKRKPKVVPVVSELNLAAMKALDVRVRAG